MQRLLILLIACASVSLLPAEAIRVTSGGAVSLQNAIDAARDGDTVLVAGGTYPTAASIVVRGKTGLTLRAVGIVWLVCGDLYADVLAVSDCEDFTIDGIRARHAEKLEQYECEGSVISAENVRGLVITRCELAGSGAIGIDLGGCQEVEVNNCYLHDNSFSALSFTEVTTVALKANRISHNAATMFCTSVTGLSMIGNVITDNGEMRE